VSVETERRPGYVADTVAYPHWQILQQRAAKWRAVLLRWPGFMLVVVLPTVLATIYYGLIAADIYTSTAQFIVKDSNQSVNLSGIGAFLQSTGLATSSNDAYTVDDYLQSRDALYVLEKKIGIRAMYDRPEADFIAKFPTLLFHSSFENLYWHYTWWIEVDFDTTSNVTTFYVYAFRAQDAYKMAKEVLNLAEGQVNKMNDRARYDALKGALREVKTLQARNVAAQIQITSFRDKYLNLDPNESSTQAVALLSGLEADIASTRASVTQLQKSAPSSPQIPGMLARIDALQRQIAAEERKDAGGGKTLAPKMQEYGALILNQQFIQTMLQAAVNSLEGAEATVQQQEIYIERVEEPNVPDLAYLPYRLIYILLVLVTALLVYWIGRMLVGAVLSHLEE
jgi:capsular polysaccharide transport system permease protein